MFLLTLITLFTINPLPFYNGLASANIGISNPSTSSITLTSSTNITSLNLLPNTGFNLSPSATTASYDVLTDNFSGYTISILASDNDKTLVNTAAPTPITADYAFSSVTSPILESNILPTDSSLMNTWGIRPNKYVNTATTPYTVITNGNTPTTNMILPSPDTTGILLDITTTSNPSTANSYDIKVGAMTDGTKAAGTYTKDTTLTVVPNPIYYTITYDKNTNDTVTNMPTPNPVSSSTTATTINLSSSIPARDHYAFLGWCQGIITTTDGVDDCFTDDGTGNPTSTAGTIYNPNGDGTNLVFGIDQTIQNITTLKAMWSANSYACSAEYRLQNADGTYPSTYTSAGIVNSAIKYGDTCSYTSTQDATYYVNQTTSDTVTGPITLQVDIPRTTFTLTVTKNNTWITSATATLTNGASANTEATTGTFRWGEDVAITATIRNSAVYKNWSQTAGTASTFANANNLSTTFTMPASNATIYADAEAIGLEMQNLSRSSCTTTPSLVYDSRDDEVYTIQEMADGRCWMLDNLRLGGSSSITLTSADTNIARDWTLPANIDSGFNSYTTAQINTSVKNTEYSYDSSNNKTKAGVFYNYCAATAGTYCYAEGEANGNAEYDICPKGWRLPTTNTASGEYYALVASYTGTSAIDSSGSIYKSSHQNQYNTFVNAFHSATFAGIYQDDSITSTSVGVYSNGWASTWISGTDQMMVLQSSTTRFNIRDNSRRNNGNFIRCILDRTMQEFTTEDALSMSNGEIRALRDQRDDETYYVAKLADGNIWMLDNLRLDPTSVSLNDLKGKTNATDEVLTYFKNGGGSGQYPATGVVAETAEDSSLENSFEVPQVAISGTDNGGWTKNTIANTTYGAGSGKMGVYYNYCAASAGSYCYAEEDGVGDAAYDICPSGWQMPSGDTSVGSYYYLYNTAYAANKTNFETALSVNYAGWYNFEGDKHSVYDTTGYFWSSSHVNDPYTTVSMNSLGVGSSINPQHTGGRYGALLVRCIFKTPSMQSFTVDEGNAMTTNESRTLVDSRDGQNYTVTKLGDGNVWMTKNLAIGCNGSGSSYGSSSSAKKLTSADSNVGIDFTTPTTSLTSGNSYTNAYQTCSNTYGAWYNYTAATAGTISGDTTKDDQVYDICPKGWRIPTHEELTGITSYSAAFNPVIGGYYQGGNIVNGFGVWWSSTATNVAGARHNLTYNGSSFIADKFSNGSYNYRGFYVRCIKDKRTIANISNMQQMTPAIAENTAEGATKTLTDTRDSKTYTVKKINGTIWMTKNLAIGCNGTGNTYGTTITRKTLTKSDSNITASSWNTPTASLSNGNSLTTAYMTCSSTFGAYYNIAAASAGSITGNTNSSDATVDICPSGWRLPTYVNFQTVYGESAKFNIGTRNSGFYENGTLQYTANRNFWWTSTHVNGESYYKISTSDDVGELVYAGGYGRYYGLNVRCVAK